MSDRSESLLSLMDKRSRLVDKRKKANEKVVTADAELVAIDAEMLRQVREASSKRKLIDDGVDVGSSKRKHIHIFRLGKTHSFGSSLIPGQGNKKQDLGNGGEVGVDVDGSNQEKKHKVVNGGSNHGKKHEIGNGGEVGLNPVPNTPKNLPIDGIISAIQSMTTTLEELAEKRRADEEAPKTSTSMSIDDQILILTKALSDDVWNDLWGNK